MLRGIGAGAGLLAAVVIGGASSASAAPEGHHEQIDATCNGVMVTYDTASNSVWLDGDHYVKTTVHFKGTFTDGTVRTLDKTYGQKTGLEPTTECTGTKVFPDVTIDFDILMSPTGG
jgi:hypothetical protein